MPVPAPVLRSAIARSVLRKAPRVAVPCAFARFSTSVPRGTQFTTLKNGLTVATESSPYAQTATVGVWIDAGSRAENEGNNGTAHFLEHLAFKGTNKRSQSELEQEIENLGAHLNAYTSRENTVYYAKAFKDDVPKTVEILADILQDSKLAPAAIDRERDVILREAEEVEKQYEEVVFDHLHAVAFQGQSLGRTILGPKENILMIDRKDLTNYISTNYKADRMVLVGTGAVDHEALVSLAGKHFSGLTPSPDALGLGAPRSEKPQFVGSEVRIRDDALPFAHIAIAFEGVSWSDPDYYPALVAQAVVGNWDRTMGNGSFLGTKLSYVVSENHLANSYMSFSTSYSDTGLWGIYLITQNLTGIDDLTYYVFKEWRRLSTSVTEAEVERAKAQLKASLLLSLDGTTAIAEDIGRQLVTTGHRTTAEEIEKRVDSITVKDVQNFAQKFLWDKDIAVCALGSIEGLLDYNRLRNLTASLRW
ncbi:Metalloenzyme, LuxS/M16 peptidase-like protein [Lipomyces tetrasporus]|uniref:mitochondrial processing peptidase n=1 Tax=Lipomyces tetrasporus TaxID=54092 RepID=A0AAD7QLX3_9ASCO|nr:Metalloenzyme, LuxS/M16 peptidase-like protein [Lipomyces tetrasporus]KAJ8097380.1 Metalloenzyme, LuxS/M16 peptidase-like protein [Lipomyces tetrasporus]